MILKDDNVLVLLFNFIRLNKDINSLKGVSFLGTVVTNYPPVDAKKLAMLKKNEEEIMSPLKLAEYMLGSYREMKSDEDEKVKKMKETVKQQLLLGICALIASCLINVGVVSINKKEPTHVETTQANTINRTLFSLYITGSHILKSDASAFWPTNAVARGLARALVEFSRRLNPSQYTMLKKEEDNVRKKLKAALDKEEKARRAVKKTSAPPVINPFAPQKLKREMKGLGMANELQMTPVMQSRKRKGPWQTTGAVPSEKRKRAAGRKQVSNPFASINSLATPKREREKVFSADSEVKVDFMSTGDREKEGTGRIVKMRKTIFAKSRRRLSSSKNPFQAFK